ncbi:dTDP-4-amino-4,6-dideoxygalactose transaminase [Paracidovorax anthurii]|uniref:dTDP-4-amino-4,6-dideoxygalactose transaminase n=1 Tax=Paracidovorax anthurii TaxID=78229 RepID=A0A328YXL1_9BURK|nr:dTDP-4-amino-4,6-dideoxygalactose transaminase [Paracidovorax anthurii]RAR76962.1 dTDP-4-amino-4,6-dideoxygalactose transaminase [Paracidovorax anthurii]
MKNIPFNKPFLTGRELEYIQQAVASGKISGNGMFTGKCHALMEERFGFRSTLLTSSCTDALEMAALLGDIGPGDEVIMPSYTFVSTANAFVLRGADIVFADSGQDEPNMDCERIGELITSRTKAIVAVHYAGVACDMDALRQLAEEHQLLLVEDAAQAIDSYYKGQPLGGIGDLGAFSFHETKNIISGEGGMLCVNNPAMEKRAEIVWEKGTNRSAFWRGEVDRYGWVDIGSSFLPSDVTAAFLFAQLEQMEVIQKRRLMLWSRYHSLLKPLSDRGVVRLPWIPEYATNNAHMFYVVCGDLKERSSLIDHLKSAGVHAVFHYQSLHRSPYYADRHDGRTLSHCDRYTDCLLRLPLFYELQEQQVEYIASLIHDFYG